MSTRDKFDSLKERKAKKREFHEFMNDLQQKKKERENKRNKSEAYRKLKGDLLPNLDRIGYDIENGPLGNEPDKVNSYQQKARIGQEITDNLWNDRKQKRRR